jgi:plasmid stability protein
MIRVLPEERLRAFKQRAARHNRSAKQEHSEILRGALRESRPPLAAVLASMPTVGEDEDFARRRQIQILILILMCTLVDTRAISMARKMTV